MHQNVLLVFGQVGAIEHPTSGTVTVHHHMESYPATQWPVTDGYFKALVRLDPGPNKLRLEYQGPKKTSFSSSICLNMLPLISNPPLYLAIVIGKDSTGEYDCQGERKQKEEAGIDMAARKLRMAGYLTQAFTGEQMYRSRLGRRCFRLEEEWTNDTLSSCADGSMQSIAKVHVIRAEKTVKEIRHEEACGDGRTLRAIAKRAIEKHFGDLSPTKRYVAVVFLDATGDLQINGITHHSALDGNIGIIGSRSLYTLPSCIEEVVPAVSLSCTPIEVNQYRSNSDNVISFLTARVSGAATLQTL